MWGVEEISNALQLRIAQCVTLPSRCFLPAMFLLLVKEHFFTKTASGKHGFLKGALLFWGKIEVLFFLWSRFTRWKLDTLSVCLPIASEKMRKTELKKIFDVADYVFKGGINAPKPQPRDTIQSMGPTENNTRKRESYRGMDMEALLQLKDAALEAEELEKINDDGSESDPSETSTSSYTSLSVSEDKTDSVDDFMAFKRADFCSWFTKLDPEDIGLIYRGNLEEWVRRYSLFPRPPLALDGDQLRQVSEITDLLCGYLDIKPKRGYNPDVTSICCLDDPIQVQHRPLAQYIAFRLILDGSNYLWAKINGYTHYKSGICSYFHRPPLVSTAYSETKLMPLVFLHGLGLGPFSLYITGFMQTLLDGLQGTRRQIIVLSFPHLQQRPGWELHCPTIDEMVASMKMILHHHGATVAHFIGHSMGTVIAAWFAMRTDFVRCLSIIDPVCILSLRSDLIMNNIYKPVQRPSEVLLRYFAFRESTTAAVLAKNTFSLHNAFDFNKIVIPLCICLGGDDPIIPGYSMKRLIEYHKTARDRNPNSPKIELVFEETYNHGHFLLHGKDILPKIQSVDEAANKLLRIPPKE